VQADLTITTGRMSGRRFVLRVAQRFLLGRGQDVSIYVDDEKVSRRHALLELTPRGQVLLTDLGSRNGTFLNGRPVPPQRPLQVNSGETVELGTHSIRVDVSGLDPKARKERARTQRLDEPLLPREEFEVLGEIGRGANGIVYAVHQKLLDRRVAIKVLREDMGPQDEETRERFLREGRVCTRIHSPFVAEVYDVRITRGRVYLVMELVNGPSARDRLSGGPFPVPEALKIAEDVAHGLAAAHQAGVIHRDVKPGNILLSEQGTAKVTDFGIAKDLDGQTLTAAGEGLGTLAYVSPEQATEAKDVDPRTDVYSLGATLYHMLAGEPPFLPSSAKVLMQILDEPAPPLESHRPDCPRDVVELVHRLLEKHPADRPPTVELAARQLAALRRKHFPDFVTIDQIKPVDYKKTQSTDRGSLF
jgi:serine/threonine protein kinase